jgi:hypothetical protein
VGEGRRSHSIPPDFQLRVDSPDKIWLSIEFRPVGPNPIGIRRTMKALYMCSVS